MGDIRGGTASDTDGGEVEILLALVLELQPR